MGVHLNNYPQFDALSADDIRRALKHSRLSRTDRAIAAQYLIWRIPFADIAANLNYSRSAVCWRFRRYIVPALERLTKAA